MRAGNGGEAGARVDQGLGALGALEAAEFGKAGSGKNGRRAESFAEFGSCHLMARQRVR